MTEGSDNRVCRTCGAELQGRYCSICGERSLTPDDLSLKHYFSALFNAFTFAEGRLGKSVGAVILRPGELSKAYMEGRRVPYMRPVAMFFMANLIYFLLPIMATFNTSFSDQLKHQRYSRSIRPLVDRHLEKSTITRQELAVRYDHASTSNAKLLLVLMVFFSAPVIALLYFGKQRFLSAYVTMAFEWMTFHLLVSTILLGIIIYALVYFSAWSGWGPGEFNDDGILVLIILVLNSYCGIHMGRRFMNCSVVGSIWRALLMMLTLLFALSAYRLVLFLVTFWQITR